MTDEQYAALRLAFLYIAGRRIPSKNDGLTLAAAADENPAVDRSGQDISSADQRKAWACKAAADAVAGRGFFEPVS